MAGKKRSNNAARKAQYAKRSSGSITAKRKEAAQLRHQVNLEKLQTRIEKKNELFEKVCTTYKLDSKGKYALKRLIGTINCARLNSIITNTIKSESWFKVRRNNLSKNADALIRSTKLGAFL